MKNLVIDAGNTRVKTIVFEEDTILQSLTFDSSNAEKKIKNILMNFDVTAVILSSVGQLTEKIAFLLRNHKNVLNLTNATRVPFKNLYKTPLTLGVDRIALASAAVTSFPDKNVLVIDAGTCITFDFINAKKEYLGGAISPGINMRYKSMSVFTKKLPHLSISDSCEIIGHDTETSMHSGVINGVVFEIEGVISHYEKQFEDLTIVLTGGDLYYLSKRLKNGIFANPNFLQEGLNSILRYNI